MYWTVTSTPGFCSVKAGTVSLSASAAMFHDATLIAPLAPCCPPPQPAAPSNAVPASPAPPSLKNSRRLIPPPRLASRPLRSIDGETFPVACLCSSPGSAGRDARGSFSYGNYKTFVLAATSGKPPNKGHQAATPPRKASASAARRMRRRLQQPSQRARARYDSCAGPRERVPRAPTPRRPCPTVGVVRQGLSLGGYGVLPKGPGHVEQVVGAGARRRVRPFLAVVGVRVVGAGAWPHVPVGVGQGRRAETYLRRRRPELGDAVLRAVLVAGDHGASDAVEGDHLPRLVLLGEHRVHALERALGDARHLAQPGRGAHDHDLRGEDLDRKSTR